MFQTTKELWTLCAGFNPQASIKFLAFFHTAYLLRVSYNSGKKGDEFTEEHK
jgi:hypothetical protein